MVRASDFGEHGLGGGAGGGAAPQAPHAPNTKLSITHSFFELQSPDFAWKFVWTVRTNFEKNLKTKWPPNHKIEHNSLIS